MDVVFERVDQRRYRIGILRNARTDVGPDIAPRPGPGHPDVPHDLVHVVVEEQAGLTMGIYGQVAAGGDVGGFFRPAPEDRHEASDQRRSRRLESAGAADVGRSERLASLVDHRGRLTGPVPDEFEPGLDPRIQARLDEVLRHWQRTQPGGRLVLTWEPSRRVDASQSQRPS
jgi:hypothetical protein